MTKLYQFSNIEVVSAVEFSPFLKPIFSSLSENDIFLRCCKPFKTSIFESLLFLADYHYKHSEIKNKICQSTKESVVFFDRDYLSILVYQEYFLKKDYSSVYPFLIDYIQKMLNFQNIHLDLIVYVDAPLDKIIDRIKIRDNRTLNNNDVIVLLELKKVFLQRLSESKCQVKFLDYNDSLEVSSKEIYNLIEKIRSQK